MEENNIHTVRVLIVDPNAQLREILRDILIRGIGVEDVQDAKDGNEALNLMRDFPPDVVIADSVMKPINGIQMTKIIRSEESEFDHFTPVIILSSHADVNEIVGARDVGANEYLAKPVSAKILELRLHAVIDHPRPFVRADNFFGPDRRRQETDKYKGDNRRESEAVLVDREGE